jgi:hypothetical protein
LRAEPEPHGFLLLGFRTGGPHRAPFSRYSAARRREAGRLTAAAGQLERRPDVASVRVLRALFVPPLAGAPRHDLVLLVRTTRTDDLAVVRRSDEVRALGGEETFAGRNGARIGETESDPDAVFLLNHFTVSGNVAVPGSGGRDPLEAWLALTDWYTSTMRVDNSTALRAVDDDARFALVNYARLPSPPPRFLVDQLRRPSFHKLVRPTLRAAGMRALPGFYRWVHDS